MSPPRRILLVPTARTRATATRDLLASYARYASDAAAVPVHVVATRDELAPIRDRLGAVAGPAPELHAFEDLLEAAGCRDTPARLLAEFGRTTYDALRVLLALAALPHDQALVLDPDARFVAPLRVGDAFNDHFAARRLLYSDVALWRERWPEAGADVVARNAARLLARPESGAYFGEDPAPFYERQVVADLVASLGPDPVAAARERLGHDPRVSEAQLVGHYASAHRERYGYTAISVHRLLGDALGPEGYASYLDALAGDAPRGGIFGSLGRAVTNANRPALVELLRQGCVRFLRYDGRNLNGVEQQRLFEEVPVAAFVAAPAYAPARIAVYLSGLARNPRQNVRFLRNFLADSGADVFFHLWDTPDREYLVRALAPKAYAFEPASAAPAPPPYPRVEKMARPSLPRDNASMWYGIQQADALRQAYEREHDFRYDVVVRLRLDFYTTERLVDVLEHVREQREGWDGVVYVPDQMHSVGVNDQLALGAADTMDAYATVLEATLPRIAEDDWFHPEYVLLRHLRAHHLEVRAFPLEYLLLRGSRLSTFDVPGQVAETHGWWWSKPLPALPPAATAALLDAQAESGATIDALGLEEARAYRLRCASRGYLRYDRDGRALRFAPDADDAGLFYVVIPPDESRMTVQIRPRDLVLAAESLLLPGDAGTCLRPDASGVVRPLDGCDEEGGYLVRRRGDGVLFEWRPGFWRTPADGPDAPRGSRAPVAAGDVVVRSERLVVQPAAAGLALAPLTDASEPFVLEPVDDPLAAAVPLGLRADSPHRRGRESPPVALLHRAYEVARVLDLRGSAVLRKKAQVYLLRRADAAPGGLVRRTLRRVAKHL